MKRLGRHDWPRLFIVLVAMLLSHSSRADVVVPFTLQAQLVSRIGSFDRNFADRAGPVAHVLVLFRAGDPKSHVDAIAFEQALARIGSVGGIPVLIEEAEQPSPAELARRVRSPKVALVYFSSGLEGEMPRIAEALVGIDILTVGASAQHAEGGAVVGFDLDQARPKIILNRKSEKAQNVSFKAEFLKLARVLE